MTRLPLSLIFLSAAVIAVGCQCESPTADAPPPPVDDAEAVAADDFGDRLVDAACASYRSCDDQVFGGGVFHLFLRPVEISFDDGQPHEIVDTYGDDYTELREAVDARQPPTLPGDRCEDFAPIVTGFLGLHPAQLDDAIADETVDYDAEAAGQCIARIADPPSLCDRERTAKGDEFNMQQYRAIASRHEQQLKAHYEPCTRVLTGTIPEGETCRHIYECHEGNCEWYPGRETGECGPDRSDFWLVP